MMPKRLLQGKRALGLAMAFVLCSSLPVYAAPPTPLDPNQPNAGTIADSVKERNIAVPPKTNVQIEVSGDKEEAQTQKAGYKIQVSGFHITGQTAFPEEKLQALVKDDVNRELTFSEMEAVARRIAQYFHEQGYMVAKAYIPTQTLTDGILEIAVMPGRYDGLEIRNHSRLSDKAAKRILGRIKSGDYVRKPILERTLLLMSDTGGISIKAILAPGQSKGTTKLIVDISNTDAVTADLSMSNYGNRFTGKDLRTLNLDVHNVSGRGDGITLDVNNSGGGLTNAGLNYTLPIGTHGARLVLGYEQLHYSLGQEYEEIDVNGSLKNASICGIYPLVRSRNYNLYAQIGYNHNKIVDRIDQYDAYSDKHTNIWTLGLNGDSRDKFHGGGFNSFALDLTSGRLNIDGGHDEYDRPAQTNDDNGPRTAGSFTKAKLNFQRLQYINDHVNLYLGLTGQLASKNLDSTEKLYLGGANGVRAYPQGEASGDQGYLFTGELRWQLPNPSIQLAAFVDCGHVTVNKDPWSGAGDNSLTRSGAGLGIIFSSRKEYTVRMDYAWKVGSEKTTSDTDKNGRWWIRGIRYF